MVARVLALRCGKKPDGICQSERLDCMRLCCASTPLLPAGIRESSVIASLLASCREFWSVVVSRIAIPDVGSAT